MSYNYDFIIASLFFVIIVAVHIIRQKDFQNYSNKVFSSYVLVGALDIIFDGLSSALVEFAPKSLNWLSELVMTIFYLMQVLIMFIVFFYAKSQQEKDHRRKKWEMFISAIPMFVLAILVLTNHLSQMFFYYGADGNYYKGRGYLVMYVYAIAYVIALIVDLIVNREYLTSRKRVIIIEIMIVTVLCTVSQAVSNGILLTGLGIGLGIVLLAFTLNNPRDLVDELTGAYNSTYYNVYCQETLDRGKNFGILVVGLKNISQVNMVYGYAAGDKYLKEFARILMKSKGCKCVFRMTGERFAIMVDNDRYDEIAGEIRKLLGSTINVDGTDIRMAISLRAVKNAQKFNNASDLWEYCVYLYEISNDSVRSSYIESNDDLIEQFRYMKEVERFLYTAVKEDLFEIYLQPVWSPEKKRFVSAEVLTRLTHPTLGPVRPDVLIGRAEKNGLITEISQLQMQKVCRFISENLSLIGLLDNVKINMSPADFLKKGLAQRLLENIKKCGLPTSFFQVEITETLATEYTENLLETVRELKEAGIGICLDDFGSGFANINTVLKLPFTCIKMDRSLLFGIGTDENATYLYHSLVRIFKEMGYEIVAEGVSEERELKLVTEWGVDMIQGFYFARPMPCAELLKMLTHGEASEQVRDNEGEPDA